MKVWITVVVCLFCFQTARSQDLIVTKKGDSLNCKITKTERDYIYFTFKYENEIRQTLLAYSQIKFYQKNFFSTALVPADNPQKNKDNYQKLRIGINGGGSYMTAAVSSDVPSGFKQYIKDLKTGYHFGGDFTYFMSENVGFGLRYSMFRTENQTDNIYVYNNVTGYSSTGMLKDDISIQYIGPTLCTRISSANRKTHFVSGFSMGYLSYKNNATVISNFQLTSGALGLWWDLGLDLQLDRNLILGLSLSYTMGILRYYDYKDETTSRTINLEKDSFENISRIDVSVALKWNR